MNQREIFNKLYNKGFSYEEYIANSEKYAERINQNYTVSEKTAKTFNQEKISTLNESLYVLCVAEPWCIDCANGVPIIAMLASMMSNWHFRITSRDKYDHEFSTYFLTAGRKKIPVIVFADADGDEISRWVERPMANYRLLGQFKDQKLTQDELIRNYKNTAEFHPPLVSLEILKELILVAEKAASIVHCNPPTKKV